MNLSRPERVARFDRVERAVHWSSAILFFVLVATATVLYIPSVAAAVGRRGLVRDVHVAAGYLLPVPLLVALAGRWGRRLRADVSELDRWDAHDRRWLRSLGRDPGARPGKFNAGQKLNAAFVFGAVLVMLATGSMLHWPRPFPLSWRTGATFVHDWLAITFVVVIIGHVGMATVIRPHSLRGMLTGKVARAWAQRHHPRWLATGQAWREATPDPAARRRRLAPAFSGLAAGCAAVVAVSALLPTWSRGAKEEAATVARRFQAALERNDWEQAFGMLGRRARAGLSQDAYFKQRLMKQEDEYLDPGKTEAYAAGIDVSRERAVRGEKRVLLRVRMSNGRTTWRQVDLGRAGDKWRVNAFRKLARDPCGDVRSAKGWGCGRF